MASMLSDTRAREDRTPYGSGKLAESSRSVHGELTESSRRAHGSRPPARSAPPRRGCWCMSLSLRSFSRPLKRPPSRCASAIRRPKAPRWAPSSLPRSAIASPPPCGRPRASRRRAFFGRRKEARLTARAAHRRGGGGTRWGLRAAGRAGAGGRILRKANHPEQRPGRQLRVARG